MHSLSACIVNTDFCNRDFGVGEQDMKMVLSVQERGTFGCAIDGLAGEVSAMNSNDR